MLSSKEISMLIEATGTSVSRSEFYWLYAHRAA